jgi:predicted phage terminase large subunit-like protein
MVLKSKASVTKFQAEYCRESYYQFFLTFWSLASAEKLVASWYIRKLCDELQVISERVFDDKDKEYDLIWNCPPGTSKSSIVSILWQPWIWTRMPSARFISGSYSERLALDHSRKSRDIVLCDKYKEMYPEIQLREDQNTKGYFTNTFGGMRYAVGVGGSVIGMHAHFISVDDPIDPQGALSDLILAEANSWMTETLSRRKIRLTLTPTVLIMQRLHEWDPTGEALESKRRIKHFVIPCDTTWEIKPPELKDFYQDGLLDPVRLPIPALEEALDTLREVGYACQYGNQPIPRGGGTFKTDKLRYAPMPSGKRKWKKGPVRYWDKAISTKKGACFTVGTKVAMDELDQVWVTDVIRGQWNSADREQLILDTAKADGKETIVWVEQEPASSGVESAEATIKRLSLKGFRCKADKVSGDKELRADVFSQHVNIGNVILVTAHWNRDFVHELKFFPRSKYKDQVDSSSGAVAQLTKPQLVVGAIPARK